MRIPETPVKEPWQSRTGCPMENDLQTFAEAPAADSFAFMDSTPVRAGFVTWHPIHRAGHPTGKLACRRRMVPYAAARSRPFGTIGQVQKKTDVAKHPKVFDQVGLLSNEPRGAAVLLFV